VTAAVRITVVTYRRPVLLERALRSLVAQTRPDWTAVVRNDDPDDPRPAAVVARVADPRITLAPADGRRGGAARFNQAFAAGPEPFASLLEDDNWWEPGFLATMVAALEAHPDVALVCGNERIWREEPDGGWTDTGRTIWPTTGAPRLFPWDDADKCGAAKLCNSSLLFRTAGADAWRTPDTIPVDVTEHFRERLVPHPFLLHPAPLVNYAETLHTHRARGPGLWGQYQVLLVASVFAGLEPAARRLLAERVWERVRSAAPQSATTCLAAAAAEPAARALLGPARPRELLRFAAACLRRPVASWRNVRAPRLHPEAWAFLLASNRRPPPAA
jgi:hypothetical protein